jgi:tyrosine-protein kinase Etk/Wzc
MYMTNDQTPRYNRSDEDEDFNFNEVMRKYIRHWPFFAGSIFLTFLVAFIVNQYTPPKYKIESKFLIKEESSAMNLFDFGAIGNGGVLPKGQKLANETIKLKSRAVAEAALDQLPFDVEYYEEGIFINTEIYKKTPVEVIVDWNHTQLTKGEIKILWNGDSTYQVDFIDNEYQKVVPNEERNLIVETPAAITKRFLFDEWAELPYARFKVSYPVKDKAGSVVVKFRDRESVILQYTGDDLLIAPTDKTSSILLLSLDTHQPQKGRDYLNVLMQVFLDNELDEKNRIARNTVQFIDSQLSGISNTLSNTENKLERFRSSHRTYNITTEGSTIFEKLSELEKSLAEENFKKEYYQNLQDYLVRENYSEIIVPSGIGIDDPVLNKLIEDLIRMQSDRSRYLATQTENSPTVREVTRKIADLNVSIKEVLKNVNQNSSMLVSDLQKRIAKIESQFGRLPQTEQNLLNIKREYSLNENIYTFLLQRRAESAISLASNTPSNKIIEAAALNFIPLKLKPLLNYFLALLLGLIFPLAFIFIKDSLSTKISEVKEMEQKLRVPVLAYIGQNKKYPNLVVFNHPKAGITEAFRGLRTNINFIFPKDKQVTVMITSSVAGEGKTFCAMNLASVYSMGGKKTILVGCDMHKRFRFHDLKVSNDQGLSSLLSGQIKTVEDIIQKTEYANLDVLVPGPVPPNPSELLINDRFDKMMEELKRKYDVVILDSSPLGLTNETLYLTRMADFTIFVLRQNYSEKTFADDINNLKEKKGLKNLYVVMNDVEEKYLNHSGYGYGYYAEDQKKEPRLRKIFGELTNRAAF